MPWPGRAHLPQHMPRLRFGWQLVAARKWNPGLPTVLWDVGLRRKSYRMKIILAQPRGFCAGVVRAIDIVERALVKYGAPVYVPTRSYTIVMSSNRSRRKALGSSR